MKKRPFRLPESLEAEKLTWECLPEFLEAKGFTFVRSDIVRHGQTITATNPSSESMTIRVRQCWRREPGGRDSERIRTYSAAQLMSRIEDGDWEGSLKQKIDRERSHGVTHFMFCQRDGDVFQYAALVPISDLLPVWIQQAAISDRLIREGKLGRRKKNHARNGSSPTIWLQDDRGGQEVANALWNYPGVVDVAKFPNVDTLTLYDETGDNTQSEEGFVPNATDRRQVVQRQIKARRGQQEFRDMLCERFQNRCVISDCQVLAVLEAAHISPYRGDTDNHPENGLLLRTDLHTLFDLDLLGIHPESLVISLHPKLLSEPLYASLQGRELTCSSANRPSVEALKTRYAEFLAHLGSS